MSTLMSTPLPPLDLPLVWRLRPAAAGTPQPALLVLLHGVGSNEADMFALAPHVPAHFHVLSLRAPNTLRPGAYAWFEVQFGPTGPSIHAAQEAASRAQLGEVLASAARQLGVLAQRVLAGGFSQGGIMGLSLLLTQPQHLAGAVVMHSRLLPEVEPLIAPPGALQGKLLWVSHGTEDQVIPLARAQAIRARAATLPLALTYSEYPGGHELRPAELLAWQRWLADALPA